LQKVHQFLCLTRKCRILIIFPIYSSFLNDRYVGILPILCFLSSFKFFHKFLILHLLYCLFSKVTDLFLCLLFLLHIFPSLILSPPIGLVQLFIPTKVSFFCLFILHTKAYFPYIGFDDEKKVSKEDTSNNYTEKVTEPYLHFRWKYTCKVEHNV